MGLMDWRDAEQRVKEYYEEQGYTVLNQNDKGFPDLIVLKGSEVRFFIEVKASQKPDPKLNEVRYHQYLEELGFKVKFINVSDEKLECFSAPPDYAEAVREQNPLLDRT